MRRLAVVRTLAGLRPAAKRLLPFVGAFDFAQIIERFVDGADQGAGDATARVEFAQRQGWRN